MGLFDNKEELKTMQIYIDKYTGVQDDMRNLDIKINSVNAEIVHTRNILLVVITLFGIFTPLLFNLTSEKFDAKLDNVTSRMSGVEKRIDNIENRMDKINNKLDIIVKKLK